MHNKLQCPGVRLIEKTGGYFLQYCVNGNAILHIIFFRKRKKMKQVKEKVIWLSLVFVFLGPRRDTELLGPGYPGTYCNPDSGPNIDTGH